MQANDTSAVYTELAPLLVPFITMLVIAATLGTLLLPLLFSLYLFSTSALRRSLVFILNVCGVVLGGALAIFSGTNSIKAILDPFALQSPSQYLASFVLVGIIPILVDSILLLRLLAIYPFRRTPRITWLALVIFPVTVKIFRFVNNMITWVQVSRDIANDPAVEGDIAPESLINIKLEWIAQLLDNAYMSSVFLWRLYKHDKGGLALKTNASRRSFSGKLADLMWIAAVNFVFPTMLNLAQLISAYVGSDFLLATYLAEANIYISIIGVVFATVWVGYTKWADENSPSGRSVFATQSLGFARPPRSVTVAVAGNRTPQLPATSTGLSFGVTTEIDSVNFLDGVPLELAAKPSANIFAADSVIEVNV